MSNPTTDVLDLIFGRWRSQILYAGVELGVFDIAKDYPKHAIEISDQLDLDRDNGHRLLRALSTIGLLEETTDNRFTLTRHGEHLQTDHPASLRPIARLEAGPTHYAVWTHLVDIITDGGPDGFEREFGHDVFTHAETNPDYAARFHDSMQSLTTLEADWIQTSLPDTWTTDVAHVCDVGGGHGHLLATLLTDHPELRGTILELPPVVDDTARHDPRIHDLGDRITFEPGDFFERVPTADAYFLKHILHDWPDDECTNILTTIHDAAPEDATVYVCELVVPDDGTPHLGKLFDIHMLVAGDGRERTTTEYQRLFDATDFEQTAIHDTAQSPLTIIEATPTTT